MTSIWGMLILGAAGSILGTLLILLVKRAFSYLFPKLVQKLKALFKSSYVWIIKKAINEQTRLYFMSSKSKSQAYYSSLVARIALWLFVTTWLILCAIFTFGAGILWLSVCISSLAFFSLFIALRSYICLSAIWYFDLEAKVDETAKEAIEEAVENAVEHVLPQVIKEFVESQANKSIQPTANASAD